MKSAVHKIVVALILSGVSATSSFGAWTMGVSEGTLSLLLQGRCIHVLGVVSRELRPCAQAAAALADILDQDFALDTSFGDGFGGTDMIEGAASFRRELMALLQKPAALAFVHNTTEALAQMGTGEAGTMWDWAVSQGGTPARALQWLAVLFQDTDEGAHVQYLVRRRPPTLTEGTLEELGELSQRLAEPRIFTSHYPTGYRIESADP